MKRDLEIYLGIYARIVLECLRVGISVALIVGVMWLLFAVEPGRGWSWPY